MQPDECHATKCGDALRSFGDFQRSRQKDSGAAWQFVTADPSFWVSWPFAGQLIPDIFSFPPCTAHFLFDVSKRKWGVHPHGKTVYSRAAKWHHAASPAAVRRAPCWSKEKVGDIPMGKAHLGLQFRMVSPCSLVPHSGTFPSQFINQFMVNQKERSSWQSI